MAERERQGSAHCFEVVVERDVMVAMRDGVRLATDIYRPASGGVPVPGPFPVILERTPYDKGAPRFVVQARFFAEHGYVVLIQDVRGRGSSQGEWYAFAREAPDGYDAIEWAAAQPWSSGKIGTMGTSYMAATQSAAATLNPPHLAAMFITEGPSNYYHCSMRHNGALEQRLLIMPSTWQSRAPRRAPIRQCASRCWRRAAISANGLNGCRSSVAPLRFGCCRATSSGRSICRPERSTTSTGYSAATR